MTSPVNLLRDGLTVTPTEDGRVSVTVVLPPDLVTDYCRFLDSLAGFFQSINRKSSLASLEARSAARAPEAQAARAEYAASLVAAYDRYTAEGLSRKEAIRQISADLRAKSHPWSSADLVRRQLVASGRSGVIGRPRSRRGQP